MSDEFLEFCSGSSVLGVLFWSSIPEKRESISYIPFLDRNKIGLLYSICVSLGKKAEQAQSKVLVTREQTSRPTCHGKQSQHDTTYGALVVQHCP